ncbi:hypothetical protein PGT21_003800 [Puccinia graminis f. sp. tritici]|uniref:Uncharacterized protein n=1 Tax=Puccinia graminis f. sp. tritici TaxID=56615 RepID=A0A5B0SC33_PUCGR|nr:hypothetical protein PGT21_003800 [Puccinia graminis f. sp. tritici]KAA1135596.1 hypothetical protein PGTUg99_024797 [Puccinia graminis f. sp. tritici]
MVCLCSSHKKHIRASKQTTSRSGFRSGNTITLRLLCPRLTNCPRTPEVIKISKLETLELSIKSRLVFEIFGRSVCEAAFIECLNRNTDIR